MKLPNQPAAHPLVFQDITFNVSDRNGEPWLRYHQIGEAFGYQQNRAVLNLYNANAEEFTSLMTTVIELDTPGGRQPVRIFSLRGAHLLGMFARTDRAKEFRRWVLNILEQYQQPGPKVLALPAPPEIDKDTELAIKQRAKVLADSYYPYYCLQMRHAIKSNQLASAHVASWIPPQTQMPGHLPYAQPPIIGKPGERWLTTYDAAGHIFTRAMSGDEIVVLMKDARSLHDRLQATLTTFGNLYDISNLRPIHPGFPK